jgi:hypothetical protein
MVVADVAVPKCTFKMEIFGCHYCIAYAVSSLDMGSNEMLLRQT